MPIPMPMPSGRRSVSVVIAGPACAAVQGLASSLAAAQCHVGMDLVTIPRPDALVINALRAGWEPVCDAAFAAGVAPSRTLLLAVPRRQAVLAALGRGLAGLVTPGEALERAVRRVLEVAAGEAGRARADLLDLFGAERAESAPGLSPRQTEVLALTAAGRSVDEVAAALFVSPKTVRNTLSALYGVLGVSRRSEAVAWAWRTGWLDTNRWDSRPDRTGQTPRG